MVLDDGVQNVRCFNNHHMIEVQKICRLISMLIAFGMIAGACSNGEEIIPKPTILVLSQDPNQWDGAISGSISGVNPRLHFICLYAEINDKWFALAGGESMQIQIDETQSWSCPIESSEKMNIDRIQIFLLPAGFQPPLLAGEKIIPLKLHLAATAKLSIDLTDSQN